MTCFVLFSDLKGRGNDLSEAMVFHSAGAVDKGVNLDRVCLSICQAFLSYVGFNAPTTRVWLLTVYPWRRSFAQVITGISTQ